MLKVGSSFLFLVTATVAQVDHAPTTTPPVEVQVSPVVPIPTDPDTAWRQLEARRDEAPVISAFATSGPVRTWLEPAETTAEVIVTPSSWAGSLLVGDLVAQGAGAFHLANPSFTDTAFEIAPTLAPTSGLKLFFQSHLGWATTGQVASVQISADGGFSWSPVWSLAGNGARLQTAFSLETIDLSGYAGQNIRIQFRLDTSGSAFTQTDSNVGWLVDNIQIATAMQAEAYDGFGDPTPREIQLLEYVNRARADAVAEATRLRNTSDSNVQNAIASFNVDLDLMETQFAALDRTVPPLAMNARLLNAARLHSQDMFNNAFQAHASSTNPVSPIQPGDSSSTRITRVGYNWFTVGENIFAYAKSVWYAHAGFDIDWGGNTSTGGMQSPAGHRNSNHNGTFREIGVGIVEGSNTANGTTVGPLVVTQDFGVEQGNDVPFLCGVTYTDGDGDNFYSPGEGLGDVSITVDGALYSANSSTHGAYALPLPGDGDYTVTFRRDGYAPSTQSFSVSGGASVKVDYLAQPRPVVLEVTRPNASTLRLRVAYNGAMSELAAEHSADLKNWSPLSANVSALGGGEFQIDVSRGSDPFYFRVIAQ